MDAPDGRAGLALWRHTPCDLVLTDIFMPKCDGIEVIRHLTRLWPQAKIIAITGKSDERNYLDAAICLGAHDTLEKPFSAEALLDAVSSQLQRAHPMSPPPLQHPFEGR
jgi:DNA-binding NarL/FixJ family response regulator